jgi:aminomethyltransferase
LIRAAPHANFLRFRDEIVSTPDTLKRTALHDCHVRAGARLVPFAGYEMPVTYAGVVEEHMAVRTRAGLFDVSHMGEIAVEGPAALAALQHLTCNDVSRLAPGQIQYSALTTPAGTFVDDVLVHRRNDDRYFLCVNAANVQKDFRWIQAAARGATVADLSDRYAQIAVQGPAAAAIVERVAGRDLSAVKYYWFVEAPVMGAPAIVARTGYTGEDGFEIYLPPEAAPSLWNALLEEGRSAGLVPAGLGARDTLRLEAKMALYGNDIDETTTVLEADLLFILKLDKGPFTGREALIEQKAKGIARRLVGFEMKAPGIARHGHTIVVEGAPAGTVTSGTQTPYLRKSIGLGYLPVGHDTPGSAIDIEIRDRRVPAEVVPTPFYKRKR